MNKLDGTMKWHIVIEVTQEQQVLIKGIAHHSGSTLGRWLLDAIEKEVTSEIIKNNINPNYGKYNLTME